MTDPSYGMTKYLSGIDYDDAVPKVVEALKTEGFGVLTEIDVKATLKKKLDVDFRRYIILGACNPPLAHQSLQAEEFIGILLPCNVVVAETDNGSVVSIGKPSEMFRIIDNPDIQPVADDVEARLARVLEQL